MSEGNTRKAASDRILPDPKGTETTKAGDSKNSTPVDANTRLSIPFDPKTGKLAFDSMRASTKAKLVAALRDPAAREALGQDVTNTATAPAEDAALNAMVVNMLYDVIGSVAVVLAKSRGFQASHAEVLRYTAEEKQAFAGPTLAVLNKYDLLGGKYADELLLLAAVGSVTASHVMALTQLSAGPAAKEGAAS